MMQFFGFLQTVRESINLGFTMNTTSQLYFTETFNTLADAKKQMRHLTIYFWLGMRGFYVSFPIVLYLIGPSWLLGATIILLLNLFFLMDFPLFPHFILQFATILNWEVKYPQMRGDFLSFIVLFYLM